jgi:hypothetical protein
MTAGSESIHYLGFSEVLAKVLKVTHIKAATARQTNFNRLIYILCDAIRPIERLPIHTPNQSLAVCPSEARIARNKIIILAIACEAHRCQPARRVPPLSDQASDSKHSKVVEKQNGA